VGEIFSEDEPDKIRREPDGAALVHGTVPVREINRELGFQLPEGAFSTIAGLCIAREGLLPEKGARLPLDDGTVLEIVEATGRRIEWVRIRPGPGPQRGGLD